MAAVNVFSKMERERLSISAPALLDVFLLALMFALVGSKFVLAPGMSVDLSADSFLPSMQAPEYAVAGESVSVLTAKGNSMIIFDGSIYTPETFSKYMKSSKYGGVLLVKADKNITVQELIKISRAAKKGGFSRIHIAANPEK